MSRHAQAPLPPFIPPQLATLQSSTPAGAAFVHEVKLDGYRLQPHIRNGRVTLYTRRGLDWTHRFGRTLPTTLLQLPVKTAIVDGEVIVEGKGGLPSFSALQDALSIGGKGQYVFYAFDLLYLDGRDLRELSLIESKAALAKLIPAPDVVRYSEHFEDGAALFQQACAIGLEGIISKKRSAPYRSSRGKDWLKVKCSLRQEFVVAGYVPSAVSAKAIGSLVLGYYDEGKLIHAGRVGTGFSHERASGLYRRLEPLRVPASPFAKRLARVDARDVVFVRPELVAEVKFRGWSSDGLVRHASFQGLRGDKRAEEVVRQS
jgi:bifunctional non-homologous end joining protein LigD